MSTPLAFVLSHFSVRSCIAAAALVTAAGCTSRSQVFDGYNDDQLWTAMVATARSPSYDDWKISDNAVFIDEAARRLEIHRVLKRTYVTPWSDPRRETEEWRFQIVLGSDSELDQPMVCFTARQIAVPAHVWNEADRYFSQMRTLLGPTRSPAVLPVEVEAVPVPPPLEEDAAVAPSLPAAPSNAPPSEAAAPTAQPNVNPALEPATEPAPEPLPER